MTSTLAQQVKAWRIRLKHTQLSLALALGVHPQTVSKWERGLKKPHPVFFNALCNMVKAAL